MYALSGLVRCGRCGEPMHIEGAQRLTCWGRRQKDGCREKSVASHAIEQELGAYLRVLSLPSDAQERILAGYHRAKPEAAARDAERRRLEGQRRRLSDLYQMGEIERGVFEERITALKLEIGRLGDAAAHGRSDVLDRL